MATSSFFLCQEVFRASRFHLRIHLRSFGVWRWWWRLDADHTVAADAAGNAH